jgi:predicted nucleic acid-binding protein
MILVDTSVLIDALRKADPKLRAIFASIQPAICGVIKAEVLHGAQDTKHWNKLNKSLSAFPNVSFLESLWEDLGRHLFTLRTNGVSAPFNDVMIATLAMHNNLEVWARDTHYALMQQVLPALRLYHEPP